MTGMIDETGVLRLPERAEISIAAELRETILAARCDISIDAEDVNVLTTPVVQVLMAARNHQRDAGHAFTIDRTSPSFRSCLKKLGVDQARLTTGDT